MVDKEDAVEVIDLVLEAHREQPRRLDLPDVVLVIEVAQADLRRAGDLGIVFREGQAAFIAGRQLGRPPENFRIGQLQRLRLSMKGIG